MPLARSTTARLLAASLVVTLGAAACGGDGDNQTEGGSDADTIEIEMRDIAFSPAQVDVRAGETVRFVFTNVGEAAHDAFIGDEAAQEEHEREMREQDGSGDMGDMGHGDDAEGQSGITLEPGETGELTHTFEEGDELLIGCHQPGHYAAGMIVTLNVT